MKISLALHSDIGSMDMMLVGGEYEFADPSSTGASTCKLTIKDFLMDSLVFKVEAAEVETVVSLIRKSWVHPLVSGPMGVDGVTITLSFEESMAKSSFTWWVEAGRGWGALEKIVDALLELGRKHLGREFRALGVH